MLWRISAIAAVALTWAACATSGPDPGDAPSSPAVDTIGQQRSGTRSLAGPAKRALLVGIDRYGEAAAGLSVPQDERWSTLRGARRDVDTLAVELKRRGFEIGVLRDEEATRDGIIGAFRQHLIEPAVPGRHDVVLFHYSGHGQRIPDDNGSPDEPDGFDEALIPWDNLGVVDYRRHLRDDTLQQLLAELSQRTDNIVVSLDSCHSGTGTRSMLTPRGAPPRHAAAETRGQASDAGPSGWLSGGDGVGWVVLSAARADQLAGETQLGGGDRSTMGIFSYELVRALGAATPETTYRDLMDRISVTISARTRHQTPQIEGDADKILFSGEWSRPPPYFLAHGPDKNNFVTVAAGSIHGLARGTVLGLHPLGKATLDPDGAVSRIEVVRVEPGRAWARAASGEAQIDPAIVATGARAVIERQSYVPSRIRVAIATASDRLEGSLGTLGCVELVADGEGQSASTSPVWDVRIEKRGDRAVQLRRRDGDVVPIPMGEGRPMALELAHDDPALADQIAGALEAHYRRQRLAGLANLHAPSKLDVRLDIERLDQTDGPGVPVPKNGTGTLAVGDRFRFIVQNRSDRTAHVRILSLNTDGSIDLAYPSDVDPPGEDVLPPQSRRVISAVFRASLPAGAQLFKVIASSKPLDVRGLRHSVSRGPLPAGMSPLAQLLADAMDGTRARPMGYARTDPWGADGAQLMVVAP